MPFNYPSALSAPQVPKCVICLKCPSISSAQILKTFTNLLSHVTFKVSCWYVHAKFCLRRNNPSQLNLYDVFCRTDERIFIWQRFRTYWNLSNLTVVIISSNVQENVHIFHTTGWFNETAMLGLKVECDTKVTHYFDKK